MIFASGILALTLLRHPLISPGPSVKLELVAQESTSRLRVRHILANNGKDLLLLDANAMRSTLLTVRFYDRNGKRVRVVGDDIMPYVPLDPEKAITLYEGDFVGFERTYVIKGSVPVTQIKAAFSYEHEKAPSLGVWEGTILSQPLIVPPYKPRK